MLRQAAAVIALTAAGCFAGSAEAAIFRLQGSTYSDYGTFTTSAGTYRISGEFRVNTNQGSTAGAGNQLTAWNIVIKNNGGTVLNQFVNGYSGITNNSSRGGDSPNSFSVTCDPSSAGCTSGDTLAVAFPTTFNNMIGDSYSPTTPNFATISSSGITYLGNGSTAVAAQADFVPFTPAFIGFLPLLGLLSRLRQGRVIAGTES